MIAENTPAPQPKPSIWAPALVIAFGMSLGLLGDGQFTALARTFIVAATLASTFQLLFEPLLAPWRRSCRSPLFLPYSLAACALMVGWSMLVLVLPQAWNLAQNSRLTEPTLILLKGVDVVTLDLITQVGLSWFLGLVACLWARRRCVSGAVGDRKPSPWRFFLGVLASLPIVVFSGWLLHLWWCGSQLEPDLREFCRRGGDGDTTVHAEFRSAIDEVDAPAYLSDPDEPRLICAYAIREMPQLPELLKWPKRAEINARWWRYRAATSKKSHDR